MYNVVWYVATEPLPKGEGWISYKEKIIYIAENQTLPERMLVHSHELLHYFAWHLGFKHHCHSHRFIHELIDSLF